MKSQLRIKAIEPSNSNIDPAKQEALDAAVLAAISSQLPTFLAAHADGAEHMDLRLSAEADRIGTATVSDSSSDSPAEAAGDYPSFRSYDSSQLTYDSDINDVIWNLQDQLDGLRRKNDLLMDEKMQLLQRRELEEEQRASWIIALQRRIAETLIAKDGLNQVKDEMLAQRQEQHTRDIKDLQKKIGSALRQRDEALIDNDSSTESRLREADKYKDEVERLQDEIEDRLLSGDGNVGQHLDDLQFQHRQKIGALQAELKHIKDKSKKDEKTFNNRVKEVERRMKSVDTEKGKVDLALMSATRDLNKLEKERNALARKLEYEQIARKRDKDDIMRLGKEAETMRQQKHEALREASTSMKAAAEGENLREEVMEAADRLRQVEADAREERLRLQDELREAKEKAKELLNDRHRRVNDATFRKLQNELTLMKNRAEDSRKKSEATVINLHKQHEAALTKVTQQLSDSVKEKDTVRERSNQEIFQAVLERDTVKRSLDDERAQIAELEHDLTGLTDQVAAFQRESRLRIERDRMDKFRQMAVLKQRLEQASDTHMQMELGLENRIHALEKEAEQNTLQAKAVIGQLREENRELVNRHEELQGSMSQLHDNLRKQQEANDAESRRVIFGEAEIKRKEMEIHSLNEMIRYERESHDNIRNALRKEIEDLNDESFKNDRVDHVRQEMEKALADMMAVENEKVAALEESAIKMKVELQKVRNIEEELTAERIKVAQLEKELDGRFEQASGSPVGSKTRSRNFKSAAAAEARVIALERRVDELQKTAPPPASALATDAYAKKVEDELEDAFKKIVVMTKRHEDAVKEGMNLRSKLLERDEMIEKLQQQNMALDGERVTALEACRLLEATKQEMETALVVAQEETETALTQKLILERAVETGFSGSPKLKRLQSKESLRSGATANSKLRSVSSKKDAKAGKSSEKNEASKRVLSTGEKSPTNAEATNANDADGNEEGLPLSTTTTVRALSVPVDGEGPPTLDERDEGTSSPVGEGEDAPINWGPDTPFGLEEKLYFANKDAQHKLATINELREQLEKETDRANNLAEDVRSVKIQYEHQRNKDAEMLCEFHNTEDNLRKKIEFLQVEVQRLVQLRGHERTRRVQPSVPLVSKSQPSTNAVQPVENNNRPQPHSTTSEAPSRPTTTPQIFSRTNAFFANITPRGFNQDKKASLGAAPPPTPAKLTPVSTTRNSKQATTSKPPTTPVVKFEAGKAPIRHQQSPISQVSLDRQPFMLVFDKSKRGVSEADSSDWFVQPPVGAPKVESPKAELPMNEGATRVEPFPQQRNVSVPDFASQPQNFVNKWGIPVQQQVIVDPHTARSSNTVSSGKRAQAPWLASKS
eukprot:GHVN01072746.1.p1 GENE.GHVN01072746.1~~GHVN01072746.1.p1  ORF type:complete len:1349 (+),score=257.61 GHVN01072746.1:273-4319(+)